MGAESVTRQKKSGFNKLALAAADSQLPYHQEDGDLILMCLRHLAYALEVGEFPGVIEGGRQIFSSMSELGVVVFEWLPISGVHHRKYIPNHLLGQSDHGAPALRVGTHFR